MSTLELVSLEEAALRLQLDLNIGEVSQVLRSSLTGARVFVEGELLLSSLEYQEHDCLYYLDSDAFSGIQPGGMFRVDVPAYFIREDVPVVLTAGEGPLLANAETVPTSDYRVDRARGQILLAATDWKDKHLKVVCATGFKGATFDNAGDQVSPSEIGPEWLREAIMSLVGQVFDTSQTTNRSSEAAEIFRRAAASARVVMGSRLKKRGFCLRPVA